MSAPVRSKIASPREAVQQFVKDGTRLRSGGIAMRKPMALIYETIRQQPKNLTFLLSGFTDDGDLLIGTGLVEKIEGSYFGLEALGLSHNYRRAQEQAIPRRVAFEEYTNYAMTVRFMAAAMGLPFLPIRSLLGSDIPKHSAFLEPKVHEMDCPWTGERVVLLPACKPDVAFLHAQRCDAEGNVQLWGQIGCDQWGTLAAERIVVTVEEIVDSALIRRDPNRTYIPGFRVDAIVPVPWGAHPTQVQGYYDLDLEFKMAYAEQSRSREGFLRFLDEWVIGIPDHEGYVRKLGEERLSALKAKPYFSEPVNYGY